MVEATQVSLLVLLVWWFIARSEPLLQSVATAAVLTLSALLAALAAWA